MNMVIGDGAIANRFASYGLQSKHLIFAGSVHDSSITDTIEISKEEDAIRAALAAINNSVTFVYFSSCSIDDVTQGASPYVGHKKRMEQLIQASASNYLIFRLPQVLGLADNEGGLVHGLVKAITLGERFELWRDATRNFIDLDDVYSIVHAILEDKTHSNRVMNIASPCPTPVPELVGVLERYFGKSGSFYKGVRYSAADINPEGEACKLTLQNTTPYGKYEVVRRYWTVKQFGTDEQLRQYLLSIASIKSCRDEIK
jgi:nucleoside-diphosphate-sugar epimerase